MYIPNVLIQYGMICNKLDMAVMYLENASEIQKCLFYILF